MSDKFARLSELERQLADSPGRQIEADLKSIALSFRTFSVNQGELARLLALIGKPEAFGIWDVKNRHLLREYQYEIVRHVHNTVSAALAFLAHLQRTTTRRFRKQPFAQQFHDEFTGRIWHSPVCGFMRDLRQYLQHEGNVFTTATLEVRQGEMTSTIRVSAAELRAASDRWRSSAKTYLESLGDAFEIERVVAEYRDVVEGFWNWYVAQVRSTTGHQLAATEAIRAEMRQILGM